jgi:LmbE family N-acetylglucosaminyl deacetylase
MSRKLAAVFAHPDDDTFGISGTCAMHANDLELLVVFATSGETGRISDTSLATRETLGRVREGEALAAYHVLGIEPQLRFLRHPDGGVSRVAREDLRREVEEALEAFQPQVVITFGPEGITAHEDHITIGAVATEAFDAVREKLGDAAPGRLLHIAIGQGLMDRLEDELRARGLEPPDPIEPFQPRGVPDEAIAVRVDCSSVVLLKLNALREHRTQAADLEDLPQDLWPEVLSTEQFVMARPERPMGAPILGDVFEDLPGA